MTEQQIRDGYEQLDSALTPPPNAPELIAHRVQQRRQRRRAGIAGMATLGIVAATGAAVTLSGGDDPTEDVVANEPPAPSLVLTRPDGSTHSFADTTVSCTSPFGENRPAGERIYLTSLRELRGEELLTPFVYVEAVVSKVQGDRTFTLPVDGPGDSDSYPLTVFVADTEGAAGNEAASSAGGSTGTVRVLRAECEPTPVLQLEVDATLGSEEGKQSLDLAGTVR